MLDYINKNGLEFTYEDYVQKIQYLEKISETSENNDFEYWYILTLTSAFNLLKQYFCVNKELYFKKKEILSRAVQEKLITDESEWNEALKLSDKIGRAVRSKDENIPVIKDFINMFYKLAENFDKILPKQNKEVKEKE